MNLLEELKLEKNNLFQFYIVVGDNQKNKKIVSDFLKKEVEEKKIFFEMKGDDFLIDDARKVKKENSFLVSKEERKIFFLDYKKINLDTQNALLKTFEEVTENSHIFLFIPSEKFLLDTIKSRGRIIFGEVELDLELADKFIQGSFLEREKIIAKIDRENISIFMNSLEKRILESSKKNLEFYKKFLDLKEYIFDKGVSLKNILIWIALNLD